MSGITPGPQCQPEIAQLHFRDNSGSYYSYHTSALKLHRILILWTGWGLDRISSGKGTARSYALYFSCSEYKDSLISSSSRCTLPIPTHCLPHGCTSSCRAAAPGPMLTGSASDAYLAPTRNRQGVGKGKKTAGAALAAALQD